jgi:hypothetical protein
MIERRDVLKAIAGSALATIAPNVAAAGPAKVRVTLVRWPYT